MNIMGIPVPTMLILNEDTQATESRTVYEDMQVYGLVMHPILFIKLLILVSIPIAVIVMGVIL